MIDEKLASLNISLPLPPKPIGSYVPVIVFEKMAFVSGQIPVQDGKLQFRGKVPSEISIEEAQSAAKLCTLNALSQLKAKLGKLDRISRIIKVSAFVNSTPDFVEHPKIINAASDLLFEIFEEKGKHTRFVVGVSSLPLGSAVELDMQVIFDQS